MNSAIENAPSSGNAAGIRAQAAQWLLKRNDCKGWNEAEQAELDAWFAKSPAHEVAFLRLEAAWTRADRLAALKGPQSSRLMGALRPRRMAKMAVALGAVAMLGLASSAYVLSVVANDHSIAVSTPVGGRKIVKLADGSEIELNTDSSLRVSVDGAERRAWLEKGEAFFKIKHDAARPFLVMAEGHRITDLGTKFRVRDEGGRLEVALVEGSAQIEPTTPGRAAKVLMPGDVAIATSTAISVSRKTAQELKNDLGWERGVLVFKYATLATVVREFNRYSDQKLVIADPQLAQLTIVGTFRTNDTTSFTDLAKEVFGVRVETRGNETVLSRHE